ncbi:hypothetical protein [Microbacterium immunditiarum]|uniref:Uncharacterized protein n=1 Tax=Microbacterium immunditiarum TaxID=337480 RepID=A0A7Y9GMW5_9MICO|nr:hypothetical protein [Microbacterium immunditiarum]NYE19459.1 hypothetical protein [Microbacterium immunditiarum]
MPIELTTRLHPMWRHDDAIREFCAVHGLKPDPWQGPLTAFREVVEAYAVAQGWVKRYANNPWPFPDWTQVPREVPLFSFALEGRERHGMLGREITQADWEWIASVERRKTDGASKGN